MEGRRIRGEGLAHEQDYINERIEQAGDTDEYAEAAEILEEELKDLRALEGQSHARQVGASSNDVIEQTATMPVENDELRQGAALDATINSGVDVRQTAPDAEARSHVRSTLEGGTGSGEPGR